MRAREIMIMVFLAVPSPAKAQSVEFSLTKGDRVAFRVPAAAIGTREVEGRYVYEAEVARADTTVIINGSPDWAGVGFVPGTSVRVSRLDADRKAGRLRVRLDQKEGPDLNLSIPLADASWIVTRLFAPLSDTAEVQLAARVAVEQKLFKGALESTTPAGRERILTVLDSVLGPDTIKVVEFQGKSFLRVRAPESRFVYNENQTGEAERQAGVLNEVAFPIIRMLGEADSAATDAYGFAIIVTLKSKPMADKYAWLNSATRESITIYVPGSAAREFSAAEITSQDLIDRSVVMVRGNRIKIDLTR